MSDTQTPAHRDQQGGIAGGHTPVGGSYAKVIADSISPEGVRLTTFEVKFHRFVLAEFNTHRVFSRNSASSRAIPVEKMLDRFRYDSAMPVAWPAEQPGMQGGTDLEGDDLEDAKTLIGEVHVATYGAVMRYLGRHQKPQRLHKSVINRLLEWGQWHTAVVTATAWDNFFEQRCSPLAQPEIRVAAEKMRTAYDASEPQKLRDDQWHLPYIEFGEDDYAVATLLGEDSTPSAVKQRLVRISAARCARVSYLTQDGKRDIGQDLTLYERLTTAEPPHWSPLEHVATPWPENRQWEDDYLSFPRSHPDLSLPPVRVPVGHLPKVGNLLGWRSLRTEVEAQKGGVTFR